MATLIGKVDNLESNPSVGQSKSWLEHLRSGGLVGLPTETVYGLGASLKSTIGIQKIFQYKGRPQNNPLILHVSSLNMALEYADLNVEDEAIFKTLAEHFWPGPLTIVVRSRDCVSGLITAGTGFVGLRMPRHPIALKLIDQLGHPICAPSANKSGHISPTTAMHVMNEFPDNEDIWVLDGGPCQKGIESSIVKIHNAQLDWLRPGSVLPSDLRSCLADCAVCSPLEPKELLMNSKNPSSPGQLLKHYAPLKECYLLSKYQDFPQWNHPLAQCALLDFNGIWKHSQNLWRVYYNLEGTAEDFARRLYDVLRVLEWSDGVQSLMVVNPLDLEEKNALHFSLYDRLFRACSGRLVSLS
jgi:L-threonylcarbamoyladenylate synthase